MESLVEDEACGLDCCIHKFDVECIRTWVQDSENSCPLCKAKINELIYKKDGEEVIEKVDPKV
jgi:hypothetical protein